MTTAGFLATARRRGIAVRARVDGKVQVRAPRGTPSSFPSAVRKRKQAIITELSPADPLRDAALEVFPRALECTQAMAWLRQELRDGPQPLATLTQHWVKPADNDRDREAQLLEEFTLAGRLLKLVAYRGERGHWWWRTAEQEAIGLYVDPPPPEPTSAPEELWFSTKRRKKVSVSPEIWSNWPLTSDLGESYGLATVAFVNAYPGPCPECRKTVWWTSPTWDFLICLCCCPPDEEDTAVRLVRPPGSAAKEATR